MAIHHSQRAAAERAGFTLEERDNKVLAFHPKTAVQIFGVSAKDAIAQMMKFITMHEADDDIRFRAIDQTNRGYLMLRGDVDQYSAQIGTPTELYKLWGSKDIEWNAEEPQDEPQPTGESVDRIEDTYPEVQQLPEGAADQASAVSGSGADFVEDTYPKEPVPVAVPPVKRNENGVPYDGAVAYREGITAADCPYSSETEDDEEYANFERWNEEWDAAADQAEEEDTEKGGSVVASKYRTKYKEEGHPNHCGDWLADLLNNYCVGDKHTDLETFERICGLNGVDTSKYKREGTGWQGRIRMTGRNLLAKVVFQKGKIVVPDSVDPESKTGVYSTREIVAPADWLSAQRYSKPETK